MGWLEKWAGKNRAKISSFRQNSSPPVNKFELNFVLEAVDLRVAIHNSPNERCSFYPNNSTNVRRQRSIAFSLAKVVGKQGSRICLRHLGTDDRNDIWIMVDSDMIRPYPSGLELSVPFGFMNSHSAWSKIIARVDKEKIAPIEWFPEHPKDPDSNTFQVGEKLEAIDRRNAQLICPATISEIKEDFVLVSFDGWSGTFDYWAKYNSQDLFPVGWSSKAKHKLQQPGPYYEIVGNTKSEYKEEYSVPGQKKTTIKRRQTMPVTRKRKLSKSFEGSVMLSEDKSVVVTTDYDSDCTHMCVNDGKSKRKKRRISSPSNRDLSSTKIDLDPDFKSKSKVFKNLFKRWTEKTALETKNDSLEEENKPKDHLKSEIIDEMKITNHRPESLEKMSDNSHDVFVPQHNISVFNQFSESKPTFQSLMDYRCLPQTDKMSSSLKSDEINPFGSVKIKSGCKRKKLSGYQNRKRKSARERELEKMSGNVDMILKIDTNERSQHQSSCSSHLEEEFELGEQSSYSPQLAKELLINDNCKYEKVLKGQKKARIDPVKRVADKNITEMPIQHITLKPHCSSQKETEKANKYRVLYQTTCKAIPLISKKEQHNEANILWTKIENCEISYESAIDELDRKIQCNQNRVESLWLRAKNGLDTSTDGSHITSQILITEQSPLIVTETDPALQLPSISALSDINIVGNMAESDGKCEETSFIHMLPDPHQWTIDEVHSYLLLKSPSLESVATEFKNHEIDGQALLLMTMNTLRQYMKVKLGPAIKVESIIKNLMDGII